MLVLLAIPFLAFVALLAGVRRWRLKDDWRRTWLRACVLWAAAATLLVELLSLFEAVNRTWLALGWLGLGILAALLARPSRRGRLSALAPSLPQKWNKSDWWVVGSIVLVIGLTAIVARWAPPQTWDSLNYHMARVAHWAQDGSLRPFATGIEIQNSMPPGAEILVLNVYVLGAGDQWVNFVDWFALIGLVVGASLIAQELGAERRGQLLAALFAAALPMAIVQASSTMTDIVVACWMMVVATETISMSRSDTVAWSDYGFLALGAGLAILTKPTAFAYLLPFAVWVLVDLIRRGSAWRILKTVLLGAGLVLAVNAGYFARNWSLYGNPIAPSSRVAEHQLPWLGGRAWVSNILRNAAYQLSTPSPYVNKAIALSVIETHRLIGLDVNDKRTTLAGPFKVSLPTTNEDRAQNPLQAYTLLGILVLCLIRWRKVPRYGRFFAVAVVTSFLAFSFLFRWQIFGSRFLVPFFALAAGLAGVVLPRFLRERWLLVFEAALILTAVPWLFGIESRPLLTVNSEGKITSMLMMSREELMFANGPYLRKPYTEMTDSIRASGCRNIGLMLSGPQAEYPLWEQLGAPSQALDVEWLVAGTPSARYANMTFQPCAVIREDDSAMPGYVRGLPLMYQYASFGLYLANDSPRP